MTGLPESRYTVGDTEWQSLSILPSPTESIQSPVLAVDPSMFI